MQLEYRYVPIFYQDRFDPVPAVVWDWILHCDGKPVPHAPKPTVDEADDLYEEAKKEWLASR
jgi:hypothetical protein